MIRRFLIYFSAVFLLFNTSCKSFEKVKRPIRPDLNYKAVINENLKPAKYPKYLLVENAGVFIEAENSSNARLTFFMEKDERIFASIRFMGFEIIRAELTRDSIKYINRYKKEYYFGSIEDNKNLLPLTYDLNLLQNFIYSGFYYDENLKRREFINEFEVEEEKIEFNKVVDEGQKVELLYDKDFVKLDKVLLSDYPNMLFAEVDISRELTRIENINIVFIRRKFETLVNIDIKDIKHKNFIKTDFKTGRNYKQLETIF